ncbi:ACP phosphodiesterase [Alishewanella longhuensis]|uniref:ACP phosphodiesterase n=1 Tax=Alishewanella longhuensis TaxID=1091037 RepID=A0ABQ3L762_9ALTE|nr:ACP phosphodiesterase [Alishewanella longhuensis]GHG69844.1 ACP phosphodiesterase [Alishewanella longhuensis]
MNYLAHAALAQSSVHSLVGNLLGDFCKGVELSTLPEAVLAGLANHRAVDRYTDHHPLVQQAKRQFSAQRRRFAAVTLDVLFDHFLILHWQSFYAEPFVKAKERLYSKLAQAEPLMPPAMQLTMQRVRQQDWLSAYQQLPSLARALDHIAARIRFENQFAGIMEEIYPRYNDLEQIFLEFYPQLLRHTALLALEA